MASIDTVAAIGHGWSEGRSRREAPGCRQRGLYAHDRSDPGGHHAARCGRALASERDRHGDLRSRLLDAQVEEEGPSSSRAGCSSTSCACSRPGGHLEHRADEGVARLTCGAASYSLNTYGPEDRACRRSSPTERFSVERRPFSTRSAASAVGFSGRVAAGPDRDPRSLRGRQARDGGDRLLPAERQGDDARERTRPELEAIVPARALQELARVGQGAESETIQVGVQENQVVFGVDGIWLTARRIDGQFPNYKQLLPEQFEAEVHLPREEPSTSSAGPVLPSASRPAAPLRGGRADGLGADPGRRRGAGVVPVSYGGRGARDRLQRRVPARRARVGDRRDREAEADQPAAARAPARRERRLLYLIMPIRLAG